MKIIQSLNQNAVIVNDNGKEVILTGKGIGFGKKVGEEVDKKKSQKFIHLNTHHNKK